MFPFHILSQSLAIEYGICFCIAFRYYASVWHYSPGNKPDAFQYSHICCNPTMPSNVYASIGISNIAIVCYFMPVTINYGNIPSNRQSSPNVIDLPHDKTKPVFELNLSPSVTVPAIFI